MKIWVEDTHLYGWIFCYDVSSVLSTIEEVEKTRKEITLIDFDDDADDCIDNSSKYISVLNWLEETGRNYPIRIHHTNSVGAENMREIIERNGWKEVK